MAAAHVSPTVSNHRAQMQHREQTVSDVITRFSGSMLFVGLHVVWFAVWIVANELLTKPFDKFPFGLLTLIVSLEAIFLSTFVLISQNQQSAATDRRAEQDFQTDVYSEVLNELVAQKLGIKTDDVTRLYAQRLAEASGDR